MSTDGRSALRNKMCRRNPAKLGFPVELSRLVYKQKPFTKQPIGWSPSVQLCLDVAAHSRRDKDAIANSYDVQVTPLELAPAAVGTLSHLREQLRHMVVVFSIIKAVDLLPLGHAPTEAGMPCFKLWSSVCQLGRMCSSNAVLPRWCAKGLQTPCLVACSYMKPIGSYTNQYDKGINPVSAYLERGIDH